MHLVIDRDCNESDIRAHQLEFQFALDSSRTRVRLCVIRNLILNIVEVLMNSDRKT